MTEPTASVYRERGRVWLRMEMDSWMFAQLMEHLTHLDADDPLATLWYALDQGEREKSDQSDIFSRFDDVPTLDG